MLWDLARQGKAPKFLGKLDSRGVPVNALIVTSIVGSIAFIASLFGDGVVYIWLLNASGMSALSLGSALQLVITVSVKRISHKEKI